MALGRREGTHVWPGPADPESLVIHLCGRGWDLLFGHLVLPSACVWAVTPASLSATLGPGGY